MEEGRTTSGSFASLAYQPTQKVDEHLRGKTLLKDPKHLGHFTNVFRK
jgi:hypothetical protein